MIFGGGGGGGYLQYQQIPLTTTFTTNGTDMVWTTPTFQTEPPPPVVDPEDPIAWLRGRVTEIIDEIDWPVAA